MKMHLLHLEMESFTRVIRRKEMRRDRLSRMICSFILPRVYNYLNDFDLASLFSFYFVYYRVFLFLSC